MSRDSIPAQIRRAAEARGFSEWQLARRAGLSEHLVSEALSGGAEFSVDTLVRLAQAVDLEVALVPPKDAAIRLGAIPTVVDRAMAKLHPDRIVQVPDSSPNVLALDLEGTLISNAASVFVRPGLFRFLTCCRPLFSRIVIYTTVAEPRFRQIASILTAEGSAPDWFTGLEYIPWQGRTKDLSRIPGAEVGHAVLVDDQKVYVHPGQEAQWIPIEEFAPPFAEDDTGLELVLEELVRRTLSATASR